jgi:hypothetical protein
MTQQLAPNNKVPGDDFLDFMHAVVPIEQQTKLLGIRLGAQAAMVSLRARVAEKQFDYDKELETIIVGALMSTSALLGEEVFLQLFPGIDPKQAPWLKPSL